MFTHADKYRGHAVGIVIEPDTISTKVAAQVGWSPQSEMEDWRRQQLAVLRQDNRDLRERHWQMEARLAHVTMWRDGFALLAAIGAIFGLVRTLVAMGVL